MHTHIRTHEYAHTHIMIDKVDDHPPINVVIAYIYSIYIYIYIYACTHTHGRSSAMRLADKSMIITCLTLPWWKWISFLDFRYLNHLISYQCWSTFESTTSCDAYILHTSSYLCTWHHYLHEWYYKMIPSVCLWCSFEFSENTPCNGC